MATSPDSTSRTTSETSAVKKESAASKLVFLVGGLAGSGKTSHLRPLIKHLTEVLAFSVKYLDKDSIGKTMPGATSPEIYEAMMATAMQAKEDVIVHEGNIISNLSLFRDYIHSQHKLRVKVICLDFQCGDAKVQHGQLRNQPCSRFV